MFNPLLLLLLWLGQAATRAFDVIEITESSPPDSSSSFNIKNEYSDAETQDEGKDHDPWDISSGSTDISSRIVGGLGIFRNITSQNSPNRIIGGSNTAPGQYPYYTYLEIRTDGGNFICSATFIWRDMLLTSAHCIVDLQLDGLEILGIDSWIGLQNQNERDLADYRQVELAIPHPEYNLDTEENDIALLKLTSPIRDRVPVKLNWNKHKPQDGAVTEVLGFGTTVAGDTSFPDILQKATVLVIPFEDCNDENSYDGQIIDDAMICAGLPMGGKVCF